MNTRQLLAGTALLLLASAVPAAAQVAPDLGPRPNIRALDGEYDTRETIGAGRQMGGPAGDALARPADPNRTPVGPSSDPQPGGRENTATNVIIPPASGGEDDPGTEENPGVPFGEDDEAAAAEPAELNVAPAQTIMGTRGGGGLAEYQVYAQDLGEYEVYSMDGAEMGDVAGVVVDIRSGRLDTLILSRGGLAGVGDALYDVPWEAVARIDRNDERLYLDGDETMLRPNPEFLPGGEDPSTLE